MFPNVPRASLSLTKILGGINKTLNIANQVIPLYVQAKPIIQNASSAMKVAKEFLAPVKTTSNNTTISNPVKETKKEPETTAPALSNPVFFL